MHPRYRSLDAWRGAAALAVFLYHRFLGRAPVGAFWMAVQLFFVISGYCIAAAADQAIRRGHGFGPFMKRRLRRIAPPYLASVALAIGCRLLWKGVSPIAREWSLYLQNFAMLQWVALTRAFAEGAPLHAASDNPRLLVPVYWSLNYEEQFYLVAGLLVALALVFRVSRIALVAVALTAAVAALNFSCSGLVTGVFTDYWLQFACGIFLYVRLCRSGAPWARLLDLALLFALALTAVAAARRGELALDPHAYHFYGQLTLCIGFTGLLVALRPFDERLMRTGIGRAFGALGMMSYSLYLVHIPLMAALHWFTVRIERVSMLAADVFVVAAVLGGSLVFYRWFERPYLNRALPELDQGKPLPASASATSSASASSRASA